MKGSVLTRLAGLSVQNNVPGAAAIALGAYGSHVLMTEATISEERKKAFEVANRYHFLHSVALLGVPLASRPFLTGFLMISGCFVFCGTTYYHALTGDKTYRRFTPTGGSVLLLAWLS